MVNVENHLFLKEDCKFLPVIWVKWKQSVCSITLLYSSTFYSLFLWFFFPKIFEFKYDKVFVRYSAFISKFEWFEKLCPIRRHERCIKPIGCACVIPTELLCNSIEMKSYLTSHDEHSPTNSAPTSLEHPITSKSTSAGLPLCFLISYWLFE